VEDVLRHVVLGARDEPLDALDVPGPVGLLPAPTSEPASGSVSTIVEPHSRSTACSAKRFCSGVPIFHSTVAKVGPFVYIQAAGFAPRMNSATAHASDLGTTVPPSSGGTLSRHHSPSIRARNDLRNDSGSVTVPVAGSKIGGLRSASAKDSATGPIASRLISASMSRAVSVSTSANGPVPRSSWRPSTSKRLNSMSLRLLL
jgi:hypothetical protein